MKKTINAALLRWIYLLMGDFIISDNRDLSILYYERLMGIYISLICQDIECSFLGMFLEEFNLTLWL